MARLAVSILATALIAAAAPAWPATVRAPRAPASLAALTGVSEAEARARLGAPDVARAEGLGALWTYRLQDCALLVFFRGEESGARRLSGASASPRRRGETPLPVDACLAQAAARRAAPRPAPSSAPLPSRANDDPGVF